MVELRVWTAVLCYVAAAFCHNAEALDWRPNITCDQARLVPSKPLTRCIYKWDDPVSGIPMYSCQMVASSVDNTNIYRGYTPHWHFFLTFKALQRPPDAVVTDDEDERCVALDYAETERMSITRGFDNVTFTSFTQWPVLFLSIANRSSVNVTFRGDVLVGIARYNTSCIRNSRTSHACILSVDMFNLMPHRSGSNSGEEVWEVMKSLGGKVTHVQMLFTRSVRWVLRRLLQEPLLQEAVIRKGFQGDLNYTIFNSTHLTKLNLAHNSIRSIDPDVFKTMPNLKYVNLAWNKLTALPPTLAVLKSLQALDISGNPVDLQSNASMSSLLVPDTPQLQLRRLYLAGINISSIEALNRLLSVPNLNIESLDLSNCSLRHISQEDVQVLAAQSGLKFLNLSKNSIETVSNILTLTLHELKILNLAKNKIESPPKFLISSNLTRLDLSHNRLVNADVIHSGKVRELDISSNHITEWNDKIDWKCNKLNISRNKIKVMTRPMVDSFKKVKTVDLGGNILDCTDCFIPELLKWLEDPGNTTILNLGQRDSLVCTIPFSKTVNEASILYQNSECEIIESDINFWAGSLISLLLLAIVLLCILFYVKRFEITYLMHLISIRKEQRLIRAESIEEMQYDAFICYSGHDRMWVLKELAPKLEGPPRHYRLCLHERDFPLGSLIARNIVTAVNHSRATIVILSQAFVASQWCRWELEIANYKILEDNRRLLILVELEKLDRTTLPRHLKYLMDTRTYLEWNDKDQDSLWRRLRTALGPSVVDNETVALRHIEIS